MPRDVPVSAGRSKDDSTPGTARRAARARDDLRLVSDTAGHCGAESAAVESSKRSCRREGHSGQLSRANERDRTRGWHERYPIACCTGLEPFIITDEY